MLLLSAGREVHHLGWKRALHATPSVLAGSASIGQAYSALTGEASALHICELRDSSQNIQSDV